MSKLKTAVKLLKTPEKMVVPLASLGLFRWMPDEPYLKFVYRCQIGSKLNLDNPQTFTEKLQWLKLNDRKELYHLFVDKYEVKQYVAEKIGSEYLIPTIGIWNAVDEIPFDELPEQFVLKCTHDSGSIVICKDKSCFDFEKAKRKLAGHLKQSTYWFGREWPYKGLKPRIIAEEYLEDSCTEELRDYKFFCFNGEVKCFKVDFDRFAFHRAHYYTPDGQLLELAEVAYPPDYSRDIRLPTTIVKMKELAEKLVGSTPFLRVDFYDVNGRIYFGEMTFYPASGLTKFIYENNDEMLGNWLTLPAKK